MNRVRTGCLGGIEEDGTSYFPQRVWLARVIERGKAKMKANCERTIFARVVILLPVASSIERVGGDRLYRSNVSLALSVSEAQ